MSWALEAPRDPRIRFFSQLERFLLIILGFFFFVSNLNLIGMKKAPAETNFQCNRPQGPLGTPKLGFFSQLERFLLIILGFFLLCKKFEPYWNERGSSRNKFSVSQAPGAPGDPKIRFFRQLERFLLKILGFFHLCKKFEFVGVT